MSEINKIARIYCRVSTEEQDLSRQLGLKQWAESRGFYVAKIYAEKASGRHADRPQLLEMIKDLQAGEIVIAESMERLSRLPLAEAEALIAQINNRGARLLLPEVLDLPAVKAAEDSMESIVFKSIQDLLLKILLKSASRQAAGISRAKSEGKQFGRRVSQKRIDDVISCRRQGLSISRTAKILECSEATVKRICKLVADGKYTVSKA